MAIAAQAQFHVLAVDDSLLDRKLIERLLRTSSYQVTTVDSGSKALEFLGLQDEQSSSPSVSPYHQEIEVNLVITDYCMPGMTGYDLLKKIKETSSLKDIPVVIMSSENVPSRINRCLEGGAEEFFLKPVQMSDVERLIPYIMKRRSTDPPMEDQAEDLPPAEPAQPEHQDNIGGSLRTPVTADNAGGCTATTGGNGNKRKAVDEGGLSSPERTRPRCTVTA